MRYMLVKPEDISGILPEQLVKEDENTIYDKDYWFNLNVIVAQIIYWGNYNKGERIMFKLEDAICDGCWTFAFYRRITAQMFEFEMAWPNDLDTNLNNFEPFTDSILNQLETIKYVLSNFPHIRKPKSKLEPEHEDENEEWPI